MSQFRLIVRLVRELAVEVLGIARHVYGAVLDAVYPPQCALCGTMGDPAYCSPCRDETEWLEPRVTTLI
ncbi:MAG: hypothetical protein H3C58_06400, partial [Fimbriimonadaceae bacterium]|nr:hypothetical protein [Fimbriimonadaceae bacterium]